jgi:hypothetical protein
MLKAINPSIAPAAAGKVAPSNVIAFPAGGVRAWRAPLSGGGQPPEVSQPNPWVTPQAIERAIADVAAMPAAGLIGHARLLVTMVDLCPTRGHAIERTWIHAKRNSA